jgi:hypothetical protein
MGLWNWMVTQATGVDPAAEQARSTAADVGTQAINQKLLEQGTWTQQQYDTAQADMAAGNVSTGVNDVMGSINAEAEAGLMDGVNNVLTAPGKVVGAVGSGASTLLWGIVKAIPWWVWLAAAGALFVWMGGLELLGGKLKGRLAR